MTRGSWDSASRRRGLPRAIGVRVSTSRKIEVVADVEDAGQLVRHHDDGGPETVAQLEDQVVEPLRADRIEAGRGLVEEQDVGIERHGARQTGALAHAAADLGRIESLEPAQPDQRQFQRHQFGDLGGAEFCVFVQRQRHVLGQRHRAPQRAALEQHAETPADLHAPLGSRGPEALAVVIDVAARRPFEPDHVLEQGALAAAAGAHHDEDAAAPHGEVDVALDDIGVEYHVEVLHGDADVGVGHALAHRPMRLRTTANRPSKTMM